MTLYIGNDEISKKIILENISGGGIDLPEISEITKGKILGNDGSTLSWVDESDYIASEFNQTLDISSVTNCITKIPQDIKLELTDGTLTLKAGSKVYDGAGNVINITKDYTVDTSSGNGVVGVFYSKTQDKVWANQLVSTATSGETPPTGSGMFYNTVTKSVDFYKDGVLDESDWSLPLAIITVNEGTSTSIEQVFNGFGYIGSTIFALPGVEGLSPNGRNADGSLNNIKSVTSKVVLHNSHTSINNWPIILKNDSSMYPLSDYLEADTYPYQPATGKWYSYYSKKDNKIYQSDNGSVWVQSYGYIMGKLSTDTSFKITSFSPKNIFQAVDRNDTEWASTASKPSDRYVDLTLQASGTQYTAPANGWFYTKYTKNSETATQSMILGFSSEDIDGLGNFITMGMNSLVTNTYYRINQPIKAGKKMRFSYQKANANDTIVLGFCYDEGAK